MSNIVTNLSRWSFIWITLVVFTAFRVDLADAGPLKLEAAGVEIGQDLDSALAFLTEEYGAPKTYEVSLDKVVAGCAQYAKNQYSTCQTLVDQEYGNPIGRYQFAKIGPNGDPEVEVMLRTTGPSRNQVGFIRFEQFLPADIDTERVREALFEKYGPSGVRVHKSYIWAEEVPPFSRIKASMEPWGSAIRLEIELDSITLIQETNIENTELGVELAKRYFDENGELRAEPNKTEAPLNLKF